MQIQAGPWKGRYSASFYCGELGQFAAEIDRLCRELNGTAQFTPIEPHLELKLSGDGRGHFNLEGKADDTLWQGNYLCFRLELDQTELPAIASALRHADLN